MQAIKRGIFQQQWRAFASKRYFIVEYDYVEDTYYKRSNGHSL